MTQYKQIILFFGMKNTLELLTEKNNLLNVVTATGTVEPVVVVEVGIQVSGRPCQGTP